MKKEGKKIKIPQWILWGLVIVSFLGLLDATYLTMMHFQGQELSCSVFSGCNEVTQSKWSEIFGIPVALFGSLYYFTVLVMSLLYFDIKKDVVLKLILPLTACGFVFSIFLMIVMFFVIEAVCQYCLLSAGTSTTLFVLALLAYLRLRKG